MAHSGPTAKGSFVQTLMLTDIATGWTECAPLLVREQKLLTEVLSAMRERMPFALRGFDTDNDSVFMNETVKTYCEEAGLVFTRCRPYRKNDQAWVERKNGAVVRRAVGCRRYEGLDAAAALAGLCASLRLFVNFFQPSFKLAAQGSRWRADQEEVSPACHAISAPPAGRPDQQGRAGSDQHDLREPGPCSAAEGHPCGSGTPRRNRRPSGRGRNNRSVRAHNRAIPVGAAHRMAGGRGASDQ